MRRAKGVGPGAWVRKRPLLLCILFLNLCARSYAQDSASGPGPTPQAPCPSSEELEALGARIGAIHIVIGDVFDASTPEENHAFYRLANKLHIDTRDPVIRRQLLFKEGDVYQARLLRESERILRRNRFLFDAAIAPVAYHDGVVDLEVRTRDVWTFKTSIDYGRSGGENTTGLEIQESNLLGFGKEVTLSRRNEVDRTSNEFRYYDPQLIGSRAQLLLSYSNNSDGRRRHAQWDRPFYSLDATWAANASALDWERTDQRYVLGSVVDEFRHSEDTLQLSGGFSHGLKDGWVTRYSYGANYTNHRFAPTGSILSAAELPADRKFVYPFVGIAIFEDNYEERRNENQIERTEDLYSGKYLQASLGWADREFGSLNDAAIATFGIGDTIESENRRRTLVLQTSASTRIESGDFRNALVSGSAQHYWRVAERQLFYASLSGTLTEALDGDHQLTLGGDSGLRGYPLRYQQGSAAALLTLEHRVFTKYYLFRIFHVGGAAFADVGRTWGHGTAPTPAGVDTELGLLKDVGFGLRFGSSRSAFGNVIHVDLAFPLDGDPSIDRMQFVVETKASF